MSTLTLDEAAAVLKTTPETVSEAIRFKGLPAARIGRAYVLVESDVIDWIRTQYLEPPCESIPAAPAARSGLTSRSTANALKEARHILATAPHDFVIPVRPGELARALAPRKGPPPPKKPPREPTQREAAWRVICRAAIEEQKRATRLHHTAKRRAGRINRTPAWADPVAIQAVYSEARRLTRETGVEHHVDHDLPLRGRLVSGLHVHTNLRILPASANQRKFNRFEPC